MVMIEMECISKQQSISQVDPPELVKFKEPRVSEQIQEYDKESRQIRKHIAQEKALRQFEQRKALALAESHRMSFNR